MWSTLFGGRGRWVEGTGSSQALRKRVVRGERSKDRTALRCDADIESNRYMNIANRMNNLVQGPPPVFRLHRLGVMSRPEGSLSWIRNYRRMLVLGCRRVRLELDESPSAEETLAVTTQERRLEYATSRLNENGVVVLQDREVQLSRHGMASNGECMRAEDLEEDQRRYREQRLASCWRAGSLKRAVASASVGAGAAPSAGEAAVPGAGEAAAAGGGRAA